MATTSSAVDGSKGDIGTTIMGALVAFVGKTPAIDIGAGRESRNRPATRSSASTTMLPPIQRREEGGRPFGGTSFAMDDLPLSSGSLSGPARYGISGTELASSTTVRSAVWESGLVAKENDAVILRGCLPSMFRPAFAAAFQPA